MGETAIGHALQCRNRAEHIRFMAREVTDRDRREALLKLADEFVSLADNIEENNEPGRPGWVSFAAMSFMAERRFSARRRVFETGKIVTEGELSIDCAVRNISRTGALITVLSSVVVPQEFALGWASNLERCTVVWRRAHGLGVKFDTICNTGSGPDTALTF